MRQPVFDGLPEFAEGGFFMSQIFTRAYWRSAARELKRPKILAVTALLMAVSMAISMVSIPLPNNLHIYFTYVSKGLCAAICGPVAALVVGFAEDILGFVLHPTGAFFPGYTLSTMLAMFFYALGFYRQRLTIPRIAVTKLAVNLVCNVALGTLWNSILFGKAYLFYFWGSLGKNLTLWPIEVAVMVLVYRLVTPVLEKQGLMAPQGKIKQR